jgi:polar amino acid transport system substrate-binding protein
MKYVSRNFRRLKHCLYILILTLTSCWLTTAVSQAAVSPASPHQSSNLSKTPCELTFGWDLVKPYQYIDQSNQVVGLQIDLIRAIFNEMGCQLKLRQGEWSELLQLLKTGQIDFMADMTIIQKRKVFGIFSDVYRKETFSLYVRESDVEKYQGQSFTQLIKKGFRLGLTEGYVYNDEIELLRKTPNLKSQFSYQSANLKNYRRLIEGEIDGLLEDSLVAGYTMRNAHYSVQMERLENEVYSGDIAFLFSKQSVVPERVVQFNRALAKVKETSEYNKAWLKSVR